MNVRITENFPKDIDLNIYGSRIYRMNVTVLMTSARWGLHATVLALLENGADANIKDTFGWTALDHALHPFNRNLDVVSTLCAWPTVLDKIGCSKEDETIVKEDV